MASRLVAIAIALSFVAALIPIASASANKSNTMPCCAGKAGHCDSGIPTKLPEPQPEPMCGLKTAQLEDDGITIVAEPVQAEAHHSHSQTAGSTSSAPAAESSSASQLCRMECGACTATSSRQQKRERGIVQPITDQDSPVTTASEFENLAISFSANDNWEQTSPRGPPLKLR